ncbi:MAG: P-loop NTPase fold protein [Pseudonocardiaceae bacterium]
MATAIRDLRKEGYDLVVFIDDLDRCSARVTSEVFEAIILFLSGATGLSAKFAIGLDPAVVAAHLDTVYKGFDDKDLLRYLDGPS